MADLKKTLMAQGMRLMTDPRVMKLMQDERVMKAVMTAMSFPGKAQSFARERAEGIAKAMALATEGEVKELRRTVRELQGEIDDLREEKAEKRDAAEGKSPSARGGARRR